MTGAALAISLVALAVSLFTLLVSLGVIRRLRRAEGTSTPGPAAPILTPETGLDPGEPLEPLAALFDSAAPMREVLGASESYIAVVSAGCSACRVQFDEILRLVDRRPSLAPAVLAVIDHDPDGKSKYVQEARNRCMSTVYGEDASAAIRELRVQVFPTVISARNGSVVRSSAMLQEVRLDRAPAASSGRRPH